MSKIRIDEAKVGGPYVFTSLDVPGLNVAHADRETARRDIDATIKAMDRVRARLKTFPA